MVSKTVKVVNSQGFHMRPATMFVNEMMKFDSDINLVCGDKKANAKSQMPKEFDVLKKRLSQFLNTKVEMTCSPKGKGKISIPFSNEEELERIMNIFDKLKEK